MVTHITSEFIDQMSQKPLKEIPKKIIFGEEVIYHKEYTSYPHRGKYKIFDNLIDDMFAKKNPILLRSLLPKYRDKTQNITGIGYIKQEQMEVINEAIPKRKSILKLPTGFGKTIVSTLCAIRYMLWDRHLNGKGRVLVVLQKSLLEQWRDELNAFFEGTLPFHIIHSDFCICDVEDSGFYAMTSTGIRMSYDEQNLGSFSKKFVNRNFQDEKAPFIVPVKQPIGDWTDFIYGAHSTAWSCLIMDEIHLYSNSQSANCLSIGAVFSQARFGLSATPIKNPKNNFFFGLFILLGIPIVKNIYETGTYMEKHANLSFKPYVIEREFIRDWEPPKLIMRNITHTLTKNEVDAHLCLADFYQLIKKSILEAISQQEKQNIAEFRGSLLEVIIYLRLATTSPIIPIARELAIDYVYAGNTPLRQFLNEAYKKGNLSKEWLESNDSLLSSRIDSILKTTKTVDGDLNLKNERIIIFDSYKISLRAIGYYLEKMYGDTRPIFGRLKGEMDEINKWRKSDNGILLMTFKKGGFGLNLQGGRVIFISTLDWSDNETAQAIGRAYRVGQKKDVYIYRFNSNTGMEEGLLAKHSDKNLRSSEVIKGVTSDKIHTIEKLNISELAEIKEINDVKKKLKELLKTAPLHLRNPIVSNITLKTP